MKKIITIISSIFCSLVMAHDLPNTFEAGEPIVASEVNENFAELKNEIDNLKTQIENLDKDKGLKVVGATDPLIFGELGYTRGQNACPNKYSGSQMCKKNDLWAATSVENLDSNQPYIFRQGDLPVCDTYSIRSNSQISIIMTDGSGNLGGIVSPNFGIDNNPSTGQAIYLPFLSWIESNLTLTNNLDESVLTKDMYTTNIYSNFINYKINACNTTLPALCCK